MVLGAAVGKNDSFVVFEVALKGGPPKMFKSANEFEAVGEATAAAGAALNEFGCSG